MTWSSIKIRRLSELSDIEKQKILLRNRPFRSTGFDRQVTSILNAVRENGDAAVQSFTKKWDKTVADPLNYGEEDFFRALSSIDKKLRAALGSAAREIRSFHRHQIRRNTAYRNKGRVLGEHFIPHTNVAVYVPGGKALYPSTVLMGVIPAQLAGVASITVLSPPQDDGKVPDILLAACAITEAGGLYAAGGAQAIAAACFGTESLQPVSMIVGPGNNYVNKAKWQLAWQHNLVIDSPAGPSEVLIIAEKVAPASWIAADMLSQAEHGPDSPAILVTNDPDYAEAVRIEIGHRLGENTPRNKIKQKALSRYGCILITKTIDEAIEFSNLYRPEHLQIVTNDDAAVLRRIANAGSVFIGPYSPVAAGDYASGTNHILPTSGMAGKYSGLSVETFYRRFTYQRLSRKGLRSIAPAIEALAEVEGLAEEHGRSIALRLQNASNGIRKKRAGKT